MLAATFFGGERWRDGVVGLGADGRPQLRDEAPSPGTPPLVGRIVGGFTDHHVHLQLVDHALLASSRLGRVVDLGGDPSTVAGIARHHSGDSSTRRDSDASRTVDYAGAFLTPPGGYPSDRAWAPAGSVREIADSAAAATVIEELAAAGASGIKVASNSTAGPVFSDALFRAIVELAAAHGLPVVAHAEGPGEAQRVVRLGASQLAHAPFTERLDDEEIAEQAVRASWISTLAIHDPAARAIAIDNAARFHAAGGTVRYGTDMGNGPTPVDLNPDEVHALRTAGLDDDALLRALAPVDPLDPRALLLLLPPRSADPLAARPLTAADLKV
ncbi:hydrolase [Microbacterium sp. p3-SID338]|uniref:amidohydrolase family protein n=1 Tax=unclassified Microbacterium TaxID=2609290 RepID=UPI000C800399|nr:MULTISPECIES: amidohydrolase family protein [unclassified Microbacterium]MCT1395844.1 hydrolase [Microbacterium sp. p3-SID338]PMC03879.1 hydrolase [Microbacterium sp. UMB0228]